MQTLQRLTLLGVWVLMVFQGTAVSYARFEVPSDDLVLLAGGENRIAIPVRNQATFPLTVEFMSSDCGCTVATERVMIPARQTAEVLVNIDTENRPPGSFTRTVTFGIAASHTPQDRVRETIAIRARLLDPPLAKADLELLPNRNHRDNRWAVPMQLGDQWVAASIVPSLADSDVALEMDREASTIHVRLEPRPVDGRVALPFTARFKNTEYDVEYLYSGVVRASRGVELFANDVMFLGALVGDLDRTLSRVYTPLNSVDEVTNVTVEPQDKGDVSVVLEDREGTAIVHVSFRPRPGTSAGLHNLELSFDYRIKGNPHVRRFVGTLNYLIAGAR